MHVSHNEISHNNDIQVQLQNFYPAKNFDTETSYSKNVSFKDPCFEDFVDLFYNKSGSNKNNESKITNTSTN